MSSLCGAIHDDEETYLSMCRMLNEQPKRIFVPTDDGYYVYDIYGEHGKYIKEKYDQVFPQSK